MREGRWKTVSPSQYEWEREALHYLQTRLPDAEPYRAWSNFTFTAATGHLNEVDLLVAGPGGLYLVEVKSWHGRLTSQGADWVRRTSSGTRPWPNPLHLANQKAKELRRLLVGAKNRLKVKEALPFVRAAIFLSEPSLRVDLDPLHRLWVYGPEQKSGQPNTLPDLVTALLTQQPQDYRDRVTPALSRALPDLLEAANIGRSRKYYELGSWQMEQTPLDEGPTWQDYLARHAQLDRERRRIRIYLVERHAANEQRESIHRAAQREAKVLQGISHPGVVRCDSMEDNERGPALVFRHDERAMRLDHYIAQYGDRLDVDIRLRMVRDLAETMAHVHGQRLYHRALSARSVLVTPDGAGKRDGEAAWLRPRLQISDWQAATRAPDSTGGSSFGVPSTSRHQAHLEASALAYLAPEADSPHADPVALDVFGLGTLSYLLLSGHPPAQQRSELLARLTAEDGLRPSALADSVSEYVDELVQEATRPRVEERLTTVAAFLEYLETVEEALTAPAVPSTQPTEPADVPDLLEAKVDDVVADWRIKRRLGTGSTSRAFLAENLATGADEVLKVALSDEKKSRLAAEAKVLAPLTDSRIIRLARQEPIDIGHRTLLVLEHAGDLTLARKLRDDGRLTVDELETYSDYLFGALDFLEGEGVYHRDIKPDNIAIRVRPNRTKQLVLFDFSLAGVSVKETEAGTPRYLDPFIGPLKRQTYDWHAERYALAVTLHEMASGELPVWGDGVTEPRFTDGSPGLKPEAFDPAIRDGLKAFFLRALDRDAKQRFGSLKDMRDAWLLVFRRSDATAPVGSEHPEPENGEDAGRARDDAAAAATQATLLESAGLTPRAVSAAHRLEATTVGDLLDAAPQLLFRMPGLGAKTRQELQQRVKEWRARFAAPSPTTKAERRKAKAAADDTAAQPELIREVQLHAVGLDAIAALLVPPATGRNVTEVLATQLLLRLPDEHGVLPDLPAWPLQQRVAALVGVTPGRLGQILPKQRKRWAKEPVVASVHADVVAMLADSGNVMAVSELADALLTRRGSTQDSEPARLAVAMAAVRAAVEIDPMLPKPRLLTRRRGTRVLVALMDVADDDPEATTADDAAAIRAAQLLDYADRLGQEADRLAGEEVLPSPATVLRELTAAPGPGVALDGSRIVRLAAAASTGAAVSPRLEIYPRDLDLVRALRLAQAGVDSTSAGADQRGLTPDDVHRRVYARFPVLSGELPDHPQLQQLLEDAGFRLDWDGNKKRYQVPWRGGSAPSTPTAPRLLTRLTASPWTADSPELAAAARAEERLSVADAGSGFRALTVLRTRYVAAREELVGRFGAEPVNVTALFLAKLHELVDPRPRPTWQTILAADAAAPGSRAALKLAEYAEQAWQLAMPSLRDALGGDRPLLLHDAVPFARYRAMPQLHELAREARDGRGWLWLLCPSDDPSVRPRLSGTAVQIVTENEWIVLVDAWVTNRHRSGDVAS